MEQYGTKYGTQIVHKQKSIPFYEKQYHFKQNNGLCWLTKVTSCKLFSTYQKQYNFSSMRMKSYNGFIVMSVESTL